MNAVGDCDGLPRCKPPRPGAHGDPHRSCWHFALSRVKAFKDLLQQRGFRPHRTRIDGCVVGMCSSTGIPIRKQYTVIHNDARFHEKMNMLCDGSHGHGEPTEACPRTKMFLETAACPEGMIEKIAAFWKSEYMYEKQEHEVPAIIAAAQQIDAEVVAAAEGADIGADGGEHVSDKTRQQAQALLHRLRKAAGHPSNRALARICRDRGMPKWVVTEALNLRSQACLDTQRGEQLVVPYSLGTKPQPWQMLGTLAKGDFAEFCGWIGCGLTVTPGEAHWQNGGVESAIKAVKKTMRRLCNEATELTARTCGHLATAAHNNTDTVKGFTPNQWAYGSNPAAWREQPEPLDNKNQGARPEAFWQLQQWRPKAEDIHRQNLAYETMTRLQNAAPRPVLDYRVTGSAFGGVLP